MMINHEPLVHPIDDGHVEADVREIFRANTEKGYQDASFMRLLGHRPEILKAFVPLSKEIVELGFAAAMFFGLGRMVAAMGLTLADEREAD